MCDVFAQVSWIACGYYHSALVTVSGLCPHVYSQFLMSAYLHIRKSACLHNLMSAYLDILIFSYLHILKATYGPGGSQMGANLGWVAERAASLIVQGDKNPFISPSKETQSLLCYLPRWQESFHVTFKGDIFQNLGLQSLFSYPHHVLNEDSSWYFNVFVKCNIVSAL